MQTLKDSRKPAEGRCHRMCVPASLEGLTQAREAWAESLEGLDEAMAHNLKVVMSEALSNAVEHGARNDPSQKITVSWSLLPEWLEICVEDPGIGFGLQDETAVLSGRGRGLKLMEHFCDRVEHWINPAGGHTLKLGKKMDWSAKEMTGEKAGDDSKRQLAGILQEIYGALGYPIAAAALVEPLWQYAKRELGGASVIELRVEANYCEAAAGLEMYRGLTTGKGKDDENEKDNMGAQSDTNTTRENYPLKLGRRRVGVMSVAGPRQGPEQKALLETLAVHVGLALENERWQKHHREMEEALNAMKMAASLQSRLKKLATNAVSAHGQVYAKEKRAQAVAGDVLESAALPDGTTALMIGDVMGKGVAAAFLAGIFRAGWHLLSRRQTHPLLLMKELNGFLYDELNGQTMFVTSALTHVSADGEVLSVVNAGHTAIYAQMKSGELKILEPSGPPLGLFPMPSWELMTLRAEEVERVYMPTDGLYSWGQGAEKFTPKKLERILGDSRKMSIDALWNELQRQRENAEEIQEDDQALVVWESVPAKAGVEVA